MPQPPLTGPGANTVGRSSWNSSGTCAFTVMSRIEEHMAAGPCASTASSSPSWTPRRSGRECSCGVGERGACPRCPDAGLLEGVAADLDCKPRHAGLSRRRESQFVDRHRSVDPRVMVDLLLETAEDDCGVQVELIQQESLGCKAVMSNGLRAESGKSLRLIRVASTSAFPRTAERTRARRCCRDSAARGSRPAAGTPARRVRRQGRCSQVQADGIRCRRLVPTGRGRRRYRGSGTASAQGWRYRARRQSGCRAR